MSDSTYFRRSRAEQAVSSDERRRLLKALAAIPLSVLLPAHADEKVNGIGRNGRLRIAVYDKFPPYSDAGKGIDIDFAKALAAKLGLVAEIIEFKAGEEVGDDLRNMVWKGHYLRGEPADVMMHVPVDQVLAQANGQVRIFGPYHRESMAMARDASRVPLPEGSAAVALEVFTRERVGVEGDTLADMFLMGALNGRIRENVVHFHSVSEATKALREGAVSAVFAPRGELEGALAGEKRFAIDEAKLGELKNSRWPLGMAVKSDAIELADALGRALAELKQDGTLAHIFQQYEVTPQEA